MDSKIIFAGLLIFIAATAEWWIPPMSMIIKNAKGPKESKHGDVYADEDKYST